MLDDQVEGRVNHVAGQVQDAAGDALGNSSWQAKGKARQLAGKVQSTYGDSVSQLTDATRDNPIGALAIALGVGFLIGKLL